MVLSILRTLLVAVGLNLVTHAAAAFEADVVLTRMEAMNALVEESRRLQSTAPCSWDSTSCNINLAYLLEQTAMLPQTSASRGVLENNTACAQVKDAANCGASSNCTWNDGPKTCNVNVDRSMEILLATLYDNATCGTSSEARDIQAMLSPDPCASVSQAACVKMNTTCTWYTDGWVVTGSTCTKTAYCQRGGSGGGSGGGGDYGGSGGGGGGSGGGSGGFLTGCPSTFNFTKAFSDCYAQMLNQSMDESNETMNETTDETFSVTDCVWKGCPSQYAFRMQEAACSSLPTNVTCLADKNCSWYEVPPDSYCVVKTANATSQAPRLLRWEPTPRRLQAPRLLQREPTPRRLQVVSASDYTKLPDTCKMKGIMLLQDACRGKSKANCTGTCEWGTESRCDYYTHNIKYDSSCRPSSVAMMAAITSATGGSPLGLLGQAQMTCQSATTKDNCTAVTRPSEGSRSASIGGAAGLRQHTWLAAPSMLAAAVVTSAGLQLF